MKTYLICNLILAVVLAAGGGYLLLHGHSLAGGLILAVVVGDHVGTSYRERGTKTPDDEEASHG